MKINFLGISPTAQGSKWADWLKLGQNDLAQKYNFHIRESPSYDNRGLGGRNPADQIKKTKSKESLKVLNLV